MSYQVIKMPSINGVTFDETYSNVPYDPYGVTPTAAGFYTMSYYGNIFLYPSPAEGDHIAIVQTDIQANRWLKFFGNGKSIVTGSNMYCTWSDIPGGKMATNPNAGHNDGNYFWFTYSNGVWNVGDPSGASLAREDFDIPVVNSSDILYKNETGILLVRDLQVILQATDEVGNCRSTVLPQA